MDTHVEVPRFEYEKLSDNRLGNQALALAATLDQYNNVNLCP